MCKHLARLITSIRNLLDAEDHCELYKKYYLASIKDKTFDDPSVLQALEHWMRAYQERKRWEGEYEIYKL